MHKKRKRIGTILLVTAWIVSCLSSHLMRDEARAQAADGGKVILRLIDSVETEEVSADHDPAAKPKMSGSRPWMLDTYMEKEWYLNDIYVTMPWISADDKGRKPGQDVVVAVIDTGVDITHPDLIDNIWVNRKELNGVQGVDDDGNGYVDDVYGGNLAEPGRQMSDEQGHGTQMAGIIGMVAGNGGGVGVSYGVKIMPVKVTNGEDFTVEEVVGGFEYAIQNGADIVSMSFSTLQDSSVLRTILEKLKDKCILVAAAGNQGLEIDQPAYPAGYDFVTGVMSYGRTGVISTFSNWDNDPGNGVEYEIAAPGEKMLTTTKNAQYVMDSGTSPATALVSGAMAVVLSELRAAGKNPSPDAFKTYFLKNMKHTTTPDGRHNYLTFPRLNLEDVVCHATSVPSTPTPTASVTPLAGVPTAAAATSTPVPTSTPDPTTTVVPIEPPTPEPVFTASPTPIPTVTPTPLPTGTLIKAGDGGSRAYYRVTNKKHKTVQYVRCMVEKSRKKAVIPAYVKLSDGRNYRIGSIKKKSFTGRKKVKKVTVYAAAVTKKMMKRAIRGSGVKKVVYRNG